MFLLGFSFLLQGCCNKNECVEKASKDDAKTSVLEFSRVHRYKKPSSLNPPSSEISEGYKVMYMKRRKCGKLQQDAFFVKIVPDITGDIVKKASASRLNDNDHSINVEFIEEAGKAFAVLTQKILDEDKETNTKQALGVIINGKLVSTPHIQSQISKLALLILNDSIFKEVSEIVELLNKSK